MHWPGAGQQAEIYLHFLRTLKHETTWFSFLDIDEFLVLKGVDDIGRFMRDYESQVDCLYFNWVNYGHSGKIRREDGPTLTSYLRREAGPDRHTKMLCRSAAIDAAAVAHGHATGRGAFHHFLDNYRLPGVRCRDVLLGSTEGYSAQFGTSEKPFIQRAGFAEAVLRRGYVAHFQFRSEEDFIRRWRRGGFAQDEMWRRLYEAGSHLGVLVPRNRVYDTYLAAYWHGYTARAMRVPQTGGALGENVALGKPSWQSSVFWPADGEALAGRNAGGGNNGVRTGLYGFHTRPETRPWWIVDLLQVYRLGAVRIYNRMDDPLTNAHANELDVLASADGVGWSGLWSNPAEAPFGMDGAPLVVTPPPGLAARFVLLRLRGAGCLHLDEIEVYGTAVVPPPSVNVPEGGPVIGEG
jgi:hypothetical protein